MPDPNPGRTLTADEVSKVLQLAVELQRNPTHSTDEGAHQGDVTIEQLQQAVAELGIDPALIEKAAAEIGKGRMTEYGSPFWGGPSNFSIERTANAVLTEDDWAELVEEIRDASGRVGTPSALGKAFEWQASGEAMHISITPTSDKTLVRVRTSVADWGFVVYLFTGIFGFLASIMLSAGLKLPAPMVLSVFGGVFTTGFFGARTLFKRLCKGRRKEALEIADRVQAKIEAFTKPNVVERTYAQEPAGQEIQEVRI
jgi:hypothetical protein